MEMNYNGTAEGGASAGAGDALAPGVVIGGRFQVEALLGTGGLGHLYRAQDLKSNKPVAIRILAADISRDDSVVDRLREQVKSASVQQHKNIAAVFGMGKEGASRYIAMEFVDGQSLRHLLEKKRRAGRTFSLKGAYNVLAHVCNALSHAHQSMVHGLPGPGTILINRVGRIKLCELGVARALTPGSSTLARLGDRYCIAPELEYDPMSAGLGADIYTLGVVLYELLTSRPPSIPPAPPSSFIAGMPREVDDVVERCLQQNPGDRFGDAQQLKAAFYAAVQSANEQADVEGTVDPAQLAADRAAPRAAAPASRPIAPQYTGPAVPQATGPAYDAPAAPAPMPAPAPAPRQRTIEEILAAAAEDHAEKWLIQKDRLDFGPFNLATLMTQMKAGQFTGDDTVLDQDTGERTRLRNHPQFREFVVLLDKHFEVERMVKAEQEQHSKDKRRRGMLITIVAISLVVLGAGGAVTAYYLRKKPETLEKIIYREKQADIEKLISSIEVNWKPEPKDQAERRRKFGKRRKKGLPGDDDVTYLGDATKEGGDALLNQSAIQRVMSDKYKVLVPCVLQEKRRNAGLSAVELLFAIRGSGQVASVSVNGQSAGPFQSCVAGAMRRITFPKFDGSLTRASFSMSFK
jgi:serine/threonine-protein kinase